MTSSLLQFPITHTLTLITLAADTVEARVEVGVERLIGWRARKRGRDFAISWFVSFPSFDFRKCDIRRASTLVSAYTQRTYTHIAHRDGLTRT